MTKVLRKYGTGYLQTTVLGSGTGGYLWVRRPGPDRGEQLRRPSVALREAISVAGSGPVNLVMAEPHIPWAGPGALVYRVGGSSSLSASLLQPDSDTQPVAEALLGELAGTLAALHHRPPPSAPLPPPAGLVRLMRWLRTGKDTRAAARLHSHAMPMLGARRIGAVMNWCTELGGEPVAGEATSGTLLHGAPGTGSLIPGVERGWGWLLTGEDIAAGSAAFDLGWVVGELVECRETASLAEPSSPVDHDRLIRSFLAGYDSDLDLPAVGRAAVVRYLVHAHDFSSYVGWHESLVDSLRSIAAVVDAAALGALLSAVTGVGSR